MEVLFFFLRIKNKARFHTQLLNISNVYMNLSLIRIPKYFYACTLSMDLLLDETKSLNKNELTMFLKCNIKGLVHAIGNSNEVKSPLWLGLFRIKEKQKKQVCLTSQISHCLLSLHSTSRQNSVEFSYQVTSLLTDTLAIWITSCAI